MSTWIGSELVPDGIQWPSEVDYADGFSRSIASVSHLADISIDQGGALSAPVMEHLGALRATLEGVSGVPIAEIANVGIGISNLVGAERSYQVISAVGQVLEGVVEIVSTIAEAAGMVSGAFQAVQIIGQFAGSLLSWMASEIKAKEVQIMLETQSQQNCVVEKWGALQADCRAQIALAKGSGTGIGTSATASDLFRGVFYLTKGTKRSWSSNEPKLRARLPVSIASMYTGLCGGASRDELGHIDTRVTVDHSDHWNGLISGPRLTSMTGWNALVSHYRRVSGNSRIGIPFEKQVKMWSLIKGIMSSTRCPLLGYRNLPVFAPGTQVPFPSGQELFPILNDIVLDLYNKGSIDDGFLGLLSRTITDAYYYQPGCAISTGEGHGIIDCTDVGVYLGPFLTEALKQHETAMLQVQLERPKFKLFKAPVAKLLLGPKTSFELYRTAETARMVKLPQGPGMTAEQRKAAMWTTSIVMGGGALMIARRIAKRR